MASSLQKEIVIPYRIRSVLYAILSFIIPLIVMLLGLIALHVTPFGQHNLAISDAKWYPNGELFFARLLGGRENAFYSLNNGLGGNEWAALAWGGVSIGGLLSVFGTLETMPTIFTWICVVNIVICGPTMYALLAHERGHRASNLIFSTSYALMGFNMAYCMQTLFFWGPQMLPLVILGLLRIIRGKSPLPYVISLGICTFFDFYFAFHVGVASAFVLLAYTYANKGTEYAVRKRAIFVWFLSSMIAVLLAAPMWLPALKAYSGGGRIDQTVLDEFSFAQNMPFIQILSKLFTGAYSLDEMISGLPNIFCGILVIALVILFFMNKHVVVRRMQAAGGLLFIYMLTFYITALTLAMHGGTHTNWFPYRYSYVFSFLLICLAVEEFSRINELTLEDTKRCGAILFVATILVFSTSYEYVSGGTIILDFGLLLLMWAALRLHKTSSERAPKRVLTAFLLLVVCANLYANTVITIASLQEWELDLDEYDRNTFVNGALIDAVKMSDSSLYRMEKDKSESDSVGVDPCKYDYNGVSHSGPTERMFVHQELNRLGINWFDMRHWYSEGVPAATDYLLGLKYLISDRDLTQEKGYERLVGVEDTAIFKNEGALGIAILANKGVIDVELGNDAFQNLNRVWRVMTGGDKDIFTEQSDVAFLLHNPTSDMSITSGELRESVSQTITSMQDMTSYGTSSSGSEELHNGPYIEYSFIASQTGPIYLFNTAMPDSVKGTSVPSIKYCGFYEAGQEINGTLRVNGLDYVTPEFLRGYCANLAFAYADNQVLVNYANELNSRDITLNAEKENDLTGQFVARENQYMLFTLPWDEGWTLYVDGTKVPLEKTWDLFMSAEVPAGEHTYEMHFVPSWLGYGVALSCFAIVSTIILLVQFKVR